MNRPCLLRCILRTRANLVTGEKFYLRIISINDIPGLVVITDHDGKRQLIREPRTERLWKPRTDVAVPRPELLTSGPREDHPAIDGIGRSPTPEQANVRILGKDHRALELQIRIDDGHWPIDLTLPTDNSCGFVIADRIDRRFHLIEPN